MYKPNFNTGLPFAKILELLNELVKYRADCDGDGESMFYIICKINDRTENLLCNLGVDLNELDEEFCNPEEEYFDLMPIWSVIQAHYGQSLFFKGDHFVLYDEEKEQLFDAANNVTEHLEIFAEQNDLSSFPDLENLQQILQKIGSIKEKGIS